MKNGILLIAVVLLSTACDNKQTVAPTSLLGGICAPLRGDPDRLEELLACLVQQQYEPLPTVLGEPDQVCKILPTATQFVRAVRHDDKQNKILFGGMMSLPFTDYLKTWAPAVKQGYLKGTVSERLLHETVFPLVRVDMYLAYDTQPVQQFYGSLLRNESLAKLEFGRFYLKNVEETVKVLLSGEASKKIKGMIDRGELGYIPAPPDLTTTCATLLSNGQ